MGIDLNEIASNSVVGVVLAACSWVGARIGKLVTKINKAEKDLDALWPRFRKMEAILRGELDGDVGGHSSEACDEVRDRAGGQQDCCDRGLGAGTADKAEG